MDAGNMQVAQQQLGVLRTISDRHAAAFHGEEKVSVLVAVNE
jgi:hypothetical protein